MTEQNIDDKLLDEATGWFVRMRSDNLADQCVDDFLGWINQNPSHGAAFGAVGGLWDDLAILEKSPYRQAADNELAGATVTSLMSHKAEKTVHHKIPRKKMWGNYPSGLIAASLAFLVISFLGLRYGDMLMMDSYSTETGELAEFVLDDGSHLALNTESEIHVDIQDERRIVYLEQGEVFFEVAKDPSRPFFVETKGGLVRVLGTKFNIRQKGNHSDVTVVEGSVGVVDYGRLKDSIKTPLSLDATLTADQKFILGDDRVENRAIVADGQSALSWRDRKLVYNGEKFSALVEDINRYYKAEIRVGDPALNDIEVVAILKVTDQGTTLKALEATFNVTARPVSKDLIYLYPNK